MRITRTPDVHILQLDDAPAWRYFAGFGLLLAMGVVVYLMLRAIQRIGETDRVLVGLFAAVVVGLGLAELSILAYRRRVVINLQRDHVVREQRGMRGTSVEIRPLSEIDRVLLTERAGLQCVELVSDNRSAPPIDCGQFGQREDAVRVATEIATFIDRPLVH